MAADTDELDLSLSRRKLLAAAGIYSVGATAASLLSAEPAKAAPDAGESEAPPVAGLHTQFGADASSEVTVSWHTLQPVEDKIDLYSSHPSATLIGFVPLRYIRPRLTQTSTHALYAMLLKCRSQR